jgi:hypothetical protein
VLDRGVEPLARKRMMLAPGGPDIEHQASTAPRNASTSAKLTTLATINEFAIDWRNRRRFP